ncbi:MAG: UDP-N-acetylglucosamine 2-epimerase (non-hydrolyzing) [Fimbriimonadaceae bacterium]|nr:UDP-N-acetylglucosamine 2-epimerase (non-hydrolyzing) [Fimbriimonadaceae bacterium]QYK57148.1 MAG: UDP-N-acetylglucosamine 2-epimerase (non-hydrolyzing) [Fimbriimonadaceae bacterium]
MVLRVLTVVGARPQFIKAAAVSRAFAKATGVEESILHTGQHYDDAMSEQFFRELKIPTPCWNLGVGSSSHGAQTGRMLEQIEAVLLEARPDWVLVYGDTNSTLAGALASVKLHIPVAHVEAGLRSFNRRMPEEINRVLTDHAADLLFAPTETAVKNLADEGLTGEKVVNCGDVMYDVALASREDAARMGDALHRFGVKPGGFVLATVHRAENTDDPERLRNLVHGFAIVARQLPVVMPLHPRTRASAEASGLDLGAHAGVVVTEPVGYIEMAALESEAAVVATDSGGVQKEAYFHGRPCVTLRDETEWVELVQMGWNTLCPPNSPAAVAEAVLGAIGRKGAEGTPYGEGRASELIVEGLLARSATSGSV